MGAKVESIVTKLSEFRKDIDLDFIKKTHVHYCTPCYGGMISEPYFRSWTKGHMMFTKYKIPSDLKSTARSYFFSLNFLINAKTPNHPNSLFF